MIKDICEMFISISGIIISCIALYISIKTDKKQYNLQLLDQRFETYSTCQKFISYILLNNNYTLEELYGLILTLNVPLYSCSGSTFLSLQSAKYGRRIN